MSSAMLSVAALSSSAIATPMTMSIFSPSKHPFMKRVVAAPTYFAFDPYKTARAQMTVMMMQNASAITTAATVSASTSSSVSVSSASIVSTPLKKAACLAPISTMTVRVEPTTAPAATPAAPKTSLNYRVVNIAFKQGGANFRAPFRVVEGDIVVVEGDRGEHLGTIKTVHPVAETEDLTSTVCGKILRRATAADLESLATKREKEQSVLADICKVAKDLKLNATIADVEFQFDDNKLTIFVERATSSTFVDFRKVQRTLFKMFHCRIWFVYMDELKF